MYERTKFHDHVVEKPRTYMIANNSDGTKTLTPAQGAIIQQGTPLNAETFNKQGETAVSYAAAFDWLCTIVGAQQMEIDDIKEALASAQTVSEGANGQEV